MPVCGRFRKSPQAGPCKTAQRSGCRPHAPYRKPGRRRRRAAFPPAFPYFPADVGHRRADYGAPGFRLPQRDCAYQGSRHLPFSGHGNGTAPGFKLPRRDCAYQGSQYLPSSGQDNGTAPGFRERKFSVLPNGFLCESRSRTAPPPRSSFRLIRCLPEAQFPSVLGPAEGEGSGRPSVARRSLRGRVLRFPPLSAGAVFPGFFLLPPDGSGRHMTYRNRAIVPPRCGLQRAGSVPPRSAERRAVRRPVPVVQPPTAPRPFMGSAPLAERIPPHRAAGCSDEEAFGDHRLFPAASPLFCRFALTKGRPLLTNGFGALIFAGSPFPVRRPLPEIKSTWGGRRRQHHGRFGRLN